MVTILLFLPRGRKEAKKKILKKTKIKTQYIKHYKNHFKEKTKNRKLNAFPLFFPNLTENDNKMKMTKIGLPLNLCLRLPRWLELFQFGPATLMLVNTSIYTIENYLHHILIRITSIFFYIYMIFQDRKLEPLTKC